MKPANGSPDGAAILVSISPKLNLGDDPAKTDGSSAGELAVYDQPYMPELDPADPAIAPFLHSARMKPLANDELKLRDVGRKYHDLPAELGFLCALLDEPDYVSKKFMNDLSSEVFYDERNREILQAVLELLAAGAPINRATVVAHLQAADPAADYGTHLDLVCRLTYNPDHVKEYMRRLKVAERYRGGETYARYGFNEPFSAFLFRLRVGQIKCVAGVWHHYRAGVWEARSRHEFRPAAMRSIHPRHREAKRFTQVLDYVESAYQVQAGTLCGAYKRVGQPPNESGAYQHVGMYLPAGLQANPFQQSKKCLPVLVVAENHLLPVTPVHQVINRSPILNAQRSGHDSQTERGFSRRQV